jgi:PTS system cellobiose-specific IIB component
MIQILLCCGGGFSSSALAAKVKKDIQQYQLEDQFEIEFSPFMIAKEKMDRFDIVVCCPHLTYDVKKMVKNANPDNPIYILPPRMYGLIDIRELSIDVLDVLEMYRQIPINPVHFPDEENVMRVTRSVAYRRSNVS